MTNLIATWFQRAADALRRSKLPPAAVSLGLKVFDHEGQSMGRSCLVCHKPFVSGWTGHRICDACRDREGRAQA